MANSFSGTGNVGLNPEIRNVLVGGRPARVLELRVFFDAYKENSQGDLEQDDAASFWKNVTLWNERAERASKHLIKGARIHVVGHIKGEKWVDKESGEERKGEFIVAEDIYLSFSRVESITWKARQEKQQTQN
jgi:single-strand DNA-binding protein